MTTDPARRGLQKLKVCLSENVDVAPSQLGRRVESMLALAGSKRFTRRVSDVTGEPQTALPPGDGGPRAASVEPPRRHFAGTGIFWGFCLGLVLFAALVVFVAQNTERVRINWLFWHGRTPVVVALLAAALAAVTLQAIVGLLWRRRRRILLRERDEMKRLRAAVTLDHPASPPSTPDADSNE